MGLITFISLFTDLHPVANSVKYTEPLPNFSPFAVEPMIPIMSGLLLIHDHLWMEKARLFEAD